MNKKIFLTILIILVLIAPVYAFSFTDWLNKAGNWLTGRAVSENNLVAYYKFDEGSGTIVADSSGNGNDGTIYGTTWVEGKVGMALNFKGSIDSYVTIPNQVLNGISDVTTLFWIKTTGGGDGIISGAGSKFDNEYLFYDQISSKVYIKGASCTFGFSFNDGNWHYLAVVRNGVTGVVTVYLDNINKGTCNLPVGVLDISTNGLVIGQEQDSVGGRFDQNQAFAGVIDEIKIYRGVLTEEEIKNNMETTLGLKQQVEELQDSIYKLEIQITEIWKTINELQKNQSNQQGGFVSCPSDMVKINDYCIDKEVNPLAPFWEQIRLCGGEGKRICAMFEWYYACQIDHPEINEIGGQPEWVDDYHSSSNQSCQILSKGEPGKFKHGRCCKSAQKITISCPSDMIGVANYCIDKDENPGDTWFNQAGLCASENKRLCSPSEWYGACKKSFLELNNMTDYGEWVDSFSGGSTAALAIGDTTCEGTTATGIWKNYPSRCCK